MGNTDIITGLVFLKCTLGGDGAVAVLILLDVNVILSLELLTDSDNAVLSGDSGTNGLKGSSPYNFLYFEELTKPII